jgi:hypothetical protein
VQTEQRRLDDRFESDLRNGTGTDRGAGVLKCIICAGALADHEIGDHASRVVERMLLIGFPTPVGRRIR